MGEFAKRAVLMLGAPAGVPPGPAADIPAVEAPVAPALPAQTWEQRLADQEARLHAHVPSTREETSRKAMQSLSSWRELADQLGYTLRAQQHVPDEAGDEESMLPESGREVTVRLPHVEKKALLGAITDPLHYKLQDLRTSLHQMADAKREELTRVTDEPSTLPWYYPSLALNLPKAFVSGYRRADEDHALRQHALMDAKLDEARKSFERALAEEYSESRKAASAGAYVDGLASALVKEGQGEANKALGVYLALATVLGLGTHTAARRWVERHDPQYQQAQAVKQLISQRTRGTPPPILISTAPAPETEDIADSAPGQAAV